MRVLALLLPLSLLLLHQVTHKITTPYMDEPFFLDTMYHHQLGHLSYYNKYITTLPGLFILAYPFQKILSFFGASLLVSGRLMSILLFFFNLWLLQRILTKYSHNGSADSWSNAAIMMVMPLQTLYYVFIYTDPASCATLLLAFYQQDHPRLYDLSCLLAVLVRQNNIIWVVAISILRFIEKNKNEFGSSSEQKDLTEILVHFLTTVVIQLGEIIMDNIFQLILIISLLVFGYINGGFVLHHTQHHSLVANPMQVLYSLVVLLIMLTPTLPQQIVPLKMTLHQITKHPFSFLICASIFLPLIHHFTFWHPFNLSDNRHYVFYLHRYLFKMIPWFKYCLALLYPGVLLYLGNLTTLQPHYIQLQLCTLFFVNILVVGLTPLIEPRYYIQTILFFNLMLHIGTPGKASMTKTLFFLILDVILFWVLLCRPFPCLVLDQLEPECRFIL